MTTMERTGVDLPQRSIWYKLGWWYLVTIAALSLLNHVVGALGVYGGDDLLVFVGYATVNVYALAVLLVSYRRGERWAWWATWAFVASYALAPVYDTEIGPFYLGAAALMALAQLSTWSAFRQP